MERGFMKLWRKLKDSRCYSRGGVHRALLLTLFTEVNWKVGYFRGQAIGPGQIATSITSLASELGFSRPTVRRALADLAEDGVVCVENIDSHWARISLVNWQSYNNVPQESGQAADQQVCQQTYQQIYQQPCQQDDQQMSTIKELKKKEDSGEKRGAGEVLVPELVPARAGRVEQGRAAVPVPSSPSTPSPRSSTAFRPPTVEEVRAYCEERRNGLDAEAFVAFYQSNGWKVGRNPMQNWQAAVRTWESKRQEEARAEARARAGAQVGAGARAGQSPRPSTVAQQRYAEQDMMARMLLTDRERRNHAQNRGHAADTHRPEPALPPGW